MSLRLVVQLSPLVKLVAGRLVESSRQTVRIAVSDSVYVNVSSVAGRLDGHCAQVVRHAGRLRPEGRLVRWPERFE